MKQRYVVQQYKDAADFQNGANALALDGYVIRNFKEFCGAIVVVYEIEKNVRPSLSNMMTENQRQLG